MAGNKLEAFVVVEWASIILTFCVRLFIGVFGLSAVIGTVIEMQPLLPSPLSSEETNPGRLLWTCANSLDATIYRRVLRKLRSETPMRAASG